MVSQGSQAKSLELAESALDENVRGQHQAAWIGDAALAVFPHGCFAPRHLLWGAQTWGSQICLL